MQMIAIRFHPADIPVMFAADIIQELFDILADNSRQQRFPVFRRKDQMYHEKILIMPPMLILIHTSSRNDKPGGTAILLTGRGILTCDRQYYYLPLCVLWLSVSLSINTTAPYIPLPCAFDWILKISESISALNCWSLLITSSLSFSLYCLSAERNSSIFP